MGLSVVKLTDYHCNQVGFLVSNSSKISVIAFDAFGTLVNIGDKRAPHKILMQWMKDHGRTQQADDAAVIMSQAVSFEEFATSCGMTLADVDGPSHFGMSAKLINRKGRQTLSDVLPEKFRQK